MGRNKLLFNFYNNTWVQNVQVLKGGHGSQNALAADKITGLTKKDGKVYQCQAKLW